MADLFQTKTAEMTDYATKMEANAGTIDDIAAQTQSAIEQLRGSWQGDAAVAYEDEIMACLPTVRKMADAMRGLGQQVRTFDAGVNEMDQAGAAKFRV